jgi:hypothetical protein
VKREIRKFKRIVREIRENLFFLPGVVYPLYIKCGKKGCRCERGERHELWYVSYTNRGKKRMVFIPKEKVKRARVLVRRYKRLKDLINDLKDLNLILFKEGYGEG